MGSDTLAAAANLPRKGGPNFLQGINEVLSKNDFLFFKEKKKKSKQTINKQAKRYHPDKQKDKRFQHTPPPFIRSGGVGSNLQYHRFLYVKFPQIVEV